MFAAHPVHTTLAERFIGRDTSLVQKALLVIVGSFALWASAKIQVPFYPVPITMQTFVVLAAGMALGPRLAAATFALYLAEGLFGLPVFAGTPEKGIGLAYILGPTGGYLLGQFMAATFVGWLGERGWDRNVLSTAGAMLLGNALIYVPGLIWLGAVVGWDQPILQWGLFPFVAGDLFKLALAALALPAIWKLVGKSAR